jgi:hypothetical protein
MACPRCDAPLVEITVGRGLILRSCSRCDGRWWRRDGDTVGLDDVLSAVAVADEAARTT